jgi:2-(1,2-epoxy-1,2-dihydrophenyl)acetyl-CoA isomerase
MEDGRMETNLVLLEKKDHIAQITLNQPETLNALTYDMLQALRTSVDDVARDRDIRVIILTGTGRGFCSGANVLGGSADTLAAGGMGLRATVMEMNEVLLQIAEMEKPWLAAINGPAVGGGCALALNCDLVLAAESAYLCIGYVHIGVVLDMGCSFALPRLIGIHKAKELAFFGERIYAPQAAEMGLINRSVPDEKLMDHAQEWALRLAAGPTLAIGAMKQLLHRGQQGTLSDALQCEANMLSLISQTEDAAEGIMAFFQKREPQFKGK